MPPTPKKTESPQFIITPEYREIIRKNAYIGKKGYTISKKYLDKKDETNIKDDCTMIPFTKSFVEGPETKFYVFRENENKIYIPRFYGIERYGLPDKTEITEGQDIDCPFNGSLREIQKPIVQTYLDHVKNGDSSGSGGAILEAQCALGKTVLSIYILSILKKKTLILVHKEFLMNQWIERMKTFIPNARIGTIQGDTFDIKNKDVVIGMIQTMYRKDFGEKTGNSLGDFGLTIIDEVHRIGSEEFSKTLLKVSTRYMLGVSATVERKDKLTRILYMFIGPKIFSSVQEKTDTVVVRGLKFSSRDTEFNEMKYDFRGNPQYSTMISKLCNFVPRSQFILGILRDLIEENSNAQIIVLCHNICLLQYLYSALETEKFATVGYYKGGMKKEQLKLSEDKQIVLGSYAMASEGLDIPTLSTLVLATPKTDIIQCVGRILRVKRAKPIIVDIIDTHDTFQNQWRKRRAYYKKCNYSIMQGTSIYDCVDEPVRKCGGKVGKGEDEGEGEDDENITNECNVILDEDD
jgi:superfamily II DNA or RNA helicase